MVLRVADVVASVGGTLVAGDDSIILTGIATLDEARPSDLSFFGTGKYRAHFEATSAGAVLVLRMMSTSSASGSDRMSARSSPFAASRASVRSSTFSFSQGANQHPRPVEAARGAVHAPRLAP